MNIKPSAAAAKPTASTSHGKKNTKSRKGKGKDLVDPEKAEKEAAKAVRSAKQELASMAQQLVRDLVEEIEKKKMLKDAVSTGGDAPVAGWKGIWTNVAVTVVVTIISLI